MMNYYGYNMMGGWGIFMMIILVILIVIIVYDDHPGNLDRYHRICGDETSPGGQ